MSQETKLTNTAPFQLPQEVNGVFAGPIQPPDPETRYCLYARKSSEDDERQALSIGSQINEMTRQAETQSLQVVEVRQESHSAKYSGQRPIFQQLIGDIQNGLFNGILSWAPDRLSRNAGDLGSIVDLMDRGLLKEIRTHGQVFTNSPNDKFLLMILCSQAKLENDNRGINIKRGMRAKCEMGFRPNMAPIGYLNDKYGNKGQRKVYPDPDRAPIIKEAFEKVGYHGCSGRQVYLWLKDEVAFVTRSGKPMTLSTIYRTLSNPYYTGVFEVPEGSGNWYKGAYEPIVSKELFKIVQEKLTVVPKSMPGTKQFDFTKLLKCGECGSGITAQEKIKHWGKRYVYYHCTKLRNFECPERYTNEEKLVQEFIRILSKLTIDQIKSKREIYGKFEQFCKFRSDVLDFELKPNQANYIDQTRINIEKFVEHIFEKGNREEKRSLIGCLSAKLILKNREVCLLEL